MENEIIINVSENTSSTDTILHINRLKDIDNKIKNVFDNIAINYVDIGLLLNELKENDLLKFTSSGDIYEFAEVNYGMKKTNSFACMKIAEKFYDVEKKKIKHEFSKFSFSQLTELVSLPEDKLLVFKPDQTIKEIRLSKKYLKIIENLDLLFEDNNIEELINYIKGIIDISNIRFEHTKINKNDITIDKLISREIFIDNEFNDKKIARLDISYKDNIITYHLAYCLYNIQYESTIDVNELCNQLIELPDKLSPIYESKNPKPKEILVEEQQSLEVSVDNIIEVIEPKVKEKKQNKEKNEKPSVIKKNIQKEDPILPFIRFYCKISNMKLDDIKYETISCSLDGMDVEYLSFINLNMKSIFEVEEIFNLPFVKNLNIELKSNLYLITEDKFNGLIYINCDSLGLKNFKYIRIQDIDFFVKLESFKMLVINDEDFQYESKATAIMTFANYIKK